MEVRSPRPTLRVPATAAGSEVTHPPRTLHVPSPPTGSAMHVVASSEPFDDFYRAEYPAILRVAFLIVGTRESAEELVQDAFVRVHQRWGRLDQPGSYLHTCVVNACRDRLRRRGRLAQRMPLLVADQIMAAPVEPGGERTDLVEALAALPVRQRAALVLRFYGGFNEAEIAEVPGVRPGTVKSLVHRGLERLREEIPHD